MKAPIAAPFRWGTFRVLLACSLGHLPGGAQEAATNRPSPAAPPIEAASLPPLPPTPQESSRDSLTNLPLRLVGPGIFEIGKVRLDKKQRTVSFPAVLNMNQGPMEYFLVTHYGKTHESVLRTEAQPYHLHVAVLLLGATGADTNGFSEHPDHAAAGRRPAPASGSQPITNPSMDTMPGDKISIEVSWSVDGKVARHSAEELVFNQESESVLGTGNWVYNGSLVADGIFLAQLGGSIVSLITDPTALVNNTGRGHDNDKIWTANTNRLPSFNTPVQVTFKLVTKRDKP